MMESEKKAATQAASWDYSSFKRVPFCTSLLPIKLGDSSYGRGVRRVRELHEGAQTARPAYSCPRQAATFSSHLDRAIALRIHLAAPSHETQLILSTDLGPAC